MRRRSSLAEVETCGEKVDVVCVLCGSLRDSLFGLFGFFILTFIDRLLAFGSSNLVAEAFLLKMWVYLQLCTRNTMYTDHDRYILFIVYSLFQINSKNTVILKLQSYFYNLE